ncbi:MAG TPA: GxxExxY protein, partial [Chthoniobacterales bacterium]|nr:GxxExxY protein [Chthoniobacterales bacterium]
MNLETRKPGMGLGNYELSERVIAAAIRVHRELGPGFLEVMYEEALAIELAAAGLSFERQKLLPVFYREHLIGEHRLDLVVEGKLILELKAISQLEKVHFAIVRSYLKASALDDGLLL